MLEKEASTEVVPEVTAGREEDESHISSIGVAGDKASSGNHTDLAKPHRKQMTLSKDMCLTDPTAKELRDLLQLAHADQSTEKIEDFRESTNDLEGDDFTAEDMEQPVPNVVLPVQHPAPHPFHMLPSNSPQQTLPQTKSATTLQSCNVASQAEEHRRVEDMDETTDDLGQLTDDKRTEDEDSNDQGSCLDQDYALELSKLAMLELDDASQINDQMDCEATAAKDEYESSEEEDLVINLEAVKNESVVERLVEDEQERSIDRGSEKQYGYPEPTSSQSLRIQQTLAESLNKFRNTKGDTIERGVRLTRADGDADFRLRNQIN